MLGSIVAGVSCSTSLVAVSGGSPVLADPYGEYLGSGYRHKLVEYPVSDLRLLKRCLQKVFCSVCGSSDPFSMTQFFLTRLKGEEHRDWTMSRSIFVMPSSQESCRCRPWLRCGFATSSTLGRLVEKPTATA